MRKRKYKGRSVKRQVNKCNGTCITYDDIAYAYADKLAADDDIIEFSVNVPIESDGDYMTDFVCTKKDGSLQVRECVFRNVLKNTRTLNQLELSRQYWMHRGVSDWGVVIDEEK